jgi:hypothetical protein
VELAQAPCRIATAGELGLKQLSTAVVEPSVMTAEDPENDAKSWTVTCLRPIPGLKPLSTG